MRKIVLVLAMLALSSGLLKAQEIDLETVEVNMKKLNSDYLDKVQSDLCPSAVAKLQNEIAAFDIKKLPRYKRTETNHEVLFKSTKGNIYTNYEKGKIVNAAGKFKNVVLPKKLIKKLMKENDGWTIKRNNYVTFYEYNGANKNSYSIVLSNGKRNKKINYEIE